MRRHYDITLQTILVSAECLALLIRNTERE